MSDDNTRPDGAETDKTDATNPDTAEPDENTPETQPDGNTDNSHDDAESKIAKLRQENAAHRTKARDAEERAGALAKRLHTALVTATGALVDPDALPFDAEHLEDPDKLSAAIDALLSAKPYLKARKPSGDAGQGDRGGASGTAPKDFAGFFSRGGNA